MILKFPILQFAIFSFLTLSSLTHALVWEENEDTIGIDGRTEVDITEGEFEENIESTTVSGNTCVTGNGFRGICITFEDCFPLAAYLRDPENELSNLHAIYNEQLYNQSAPCEPDNSTVICCPNYIYTTLKRKIDFPNRKPPPTPISTASSGGFEQESCGNLTYTIDPTVIGGREAKLNEFPYMAAMVVNNKHACGGSIISKTHILTAAHCVSGIRNVNNVKIVVGSHTSPTPSANAISIPIAAVYYNKHFSQTVLGSDVALIKLAKPVEYNERIQPICLRSDKSIPEARAELAGWGLTVDREVQPSARPSTVLRTVQLDFLTNEKCSQLYQGQGTPPIRGSHVCATGDGGDKKVKDACYGDSGGPLSIVNKGRAEQVGVVSWGKKCGSYPGVYERVAHYLDWIGRTSKL